MALLIKQKEQLSSLRRMAKGTNVKITVINDIGAIRITGGRKGSKSVVTVLGNNVGVSPPEIVKARIILFKRRFN